MLQEGHDFLFIRCERGYRTFPLDRLSERYGPPSTGQNVPQPARALTEKCERNTKGLASSSSFRFDDFRGRYLVDRSNGSTDDTRRHDCFQTLVEKEVLFTLFDALLQSVCECPWYEGTIPPSSLRPPALDTIPMHVLCQDDPCLQCRVMNRNLLPGVAS
jgi:hypothetical protein